MQFARLVRHIGADADTDRQRTDAKKPHRARVRRRSAGALGREIGGGAAQFTHRAADSHRDFFGALSVRPFVCAAAGIVTAAEGVRHVVNFPARLLRDRRGDEEVVGGGDHDIVVEFGDFHFFFFGFADVFFVLVWLTGHKVTRGSVYVNPSFDIHRNSLNSNTLDVIPRKAKTCLSICSPI